MTEERKQAIEALDRIYNYCEEIDYHCPEEQRTGYKMLPDVLLISNFLHLTVSDLAERDIPKARFQCRCGVCDLDLNEVEFGTVEIETNEQLRTHYRYCPRCGQRIDWEHDDVWAKAFDDLFNEYNLLGEEIWGSNLNLPSGADYQEALKESEDME